MSDAYDDLEDMRLRVTLEHDPNKRNVCLLPLFLADQTAGRWRKEMLTVYSPRGLSPMVFWRNPTLLSIIERICGVPIPDCSAFYFLPDQPDE